MTRTMTAALVAVALMGEAMTVPAFADEVTTSSTTTTTTGPVFGYSDGYYSRDHAWHSWANQDAMVTYRKEHHEHYYDMAHTAAPDQGWREHDTYWETH